MNHDSQLVALASKTSKDQLKLVRTFACRGFLTVPFRALRSPPWAYVPREDASYMLTIPVVDL
jgi:hypothetical protein